MTYRLCILGENHARIQSITRANKRVRVLKPDYLLHELLYEDSCFTPEEIKARLANCMDGQLCDPNLNKDIYELGLELGIPIIGIDIETPMGISLEEKFAIREAHMVKMIEHYHPKGRVVAVVGDAHLRHVAIKGLGGPSPIVTRFKGHCAIERDPCGDPTYESIAPSWYLGK